ncbi:MAG: hypothetical protein PVI26_04985 [Chitinispirillia bacterium]|jgi:hypothetical protein
MELTHKDNKRSRLLEKAQKIYGHIFPYKNKLSLEDCFSFSKKGELVLWFCTQDNHTHMIADGNVAICDVITLDKRQKKLRFSFGLGRKKKF